MPVQSLITVADPNSDQSIMIKTSIKHKKICQCSFLAPYWWIINQSYNAAIEETITGKYFTENQYLQRTLFLTKSFLNFSISKLLVSEMYILKNVPT